MSHPVNVSVLQKRRTSKWRAANADGAYWLASAVQTREAIIVIVITITRKAHVFGVHKPKAMAQSHAFAVCMSEM